MISTWQQHSDNCSSAQLAGLPALASAAAAAQGALEAAGAEPEQADQQPATGAIEAQRVHSNAHSNAQSDPIEPQPTPFEAFTQAPLSTEKPEAAAPQAKVQVPEVGLSMESSAMRTSLLSAKPSPSDGVRTASTRTGGTDSLVCSRPHVTLSQARRCMGRLMWEWQSRQASLRLPAWHQ